MVCFVFDCANKVMRPPGCFLVAVCSSCKHGHRKFFFQGGDISGLLPEWPK